jgi:hypothetical protein
MEKAGSSDPAKYLPVLAKTEVYKGVTVTIALDEKFVIKNGALFALSGHSLVGKNDHSACPNCRSIC